MNGAASLNESNPDRFSPRPEEETVGSGILRNGGGESPDVTAKATDTVVGDAENAQREPEREEVIVSRDDEVVPAASPVTSVIAEEPPVRLEQKEGSSKISMLCSFIFTSNQIFSFLNFVALLIIFCLFFVYSSFVF